MFLHPDGIINSAMKSFGLEPQFWTSDPILAMPAIMWMSLWKGLGFYTVIYLAGLQTIPPTIYEAGMIDGADRKQLFWSITLPLLRPTTLFALVIGIIASFEVFIPVYLMTNGGPGYSSMVMVMAIYRAAFQQYQMGYASAMAVVLFLLIFAISVAPVQVLRAGGRVLMAAQESHRRHRSPRHRQRPSDGWAASPRRSRPSLHAVLIVVALLMFFPFFWMIATALRPPGQEADLSLIPQPYLAFENFSRAWNYPRAPFPQYTINSFVIAIVSTRPRRAS